MSGVFLSSGPRAGEGIFGPQRFPVQVATPQLIILGNQTVSQDPTNALLLKAGSVLGIITASGKAELVNSAHADGSQTPIGILASDVDTSFGDQLGVVYITGSFLVNNLLFGGTDTFATHQHNLALLNIYGETEVASGIGT